MPAKFYVGAGQPGERQPGRPEVLEIPEGTHSHLCLLPALGGILKNDLSPVGVGAGQSHTMLFTGV